MTTEQFGDPASSDEPFDQVGLGANSGRGATAVAPSAAEGSVALPGAILSDRRRRSESEPVMELVGIAAGRGPDSRAGLRILMVSRGVVTVGSNSGGAELAAFSLACQLATAGDDVVFVGDVDGYDRPEFPQKLQVAPIRESGVIRTLLRGVPFWFARWMLQHLVGNIRAAKTARGLMKQQHGGFDVVHVHGALATILLKRTVMRARAVPTLIYTEHDATPWSCRYRSHWERVIRRRIYSLLNLRACRAAELVVTPYGPLAQELAVRTGLPTDHFAVVANGSRIVTQGHEWVSGPRARHGLRRYCLFVGALTARKAPDLLLRALSTVDLPCIFVGDGPMRKELERLAVKLGLSSRIVFTGALNPSDVYDYYAEAEFLALPSVSEAVPLVVLEALASGIPVIASRLDGICSVVRDGYNGLLVDPGNVGQLSTALALLGRDTRLRDRLASCASRDRGTAPTWPRLAGQLRVAYAHTCERA